MTSSQDNNIPLVKEKHQGLIQDWVKSTENSRVKFQILVETFKNVFPTADKLVLKAPTIKEWILSGLTPEDLILYDEDLGRIDLKRDSPEDLDKKRKQKALRAKVDSYFKKLKLALFPPQDRDKLYRSLFSIHNLDREAENKKRLFDDEPKHGKAKKDEKGKEDNPKRAKVCDDPDDVAIKHLTAKYELFFPADKLTSVVRDFWLKDNRPTVMKKEDIDANLILSKDGKYLFDSVSKIPIQRLYPHKGHLVSNGDIVVGDMERFNLLIDDETDRNKYLELCEQWDLEYEMRRRNMVITEEEKERFCDIVSGKSDEILPPVSFEHLDSDTQKFLSDKLQETREEDDDEVELEEDKVHIDGSNSNGKKNPLGRGLQKSRKDYYLTPEWCIRSLLEHPVIQEEFDKFQVCYDPCCGENKIFGEMIKLYYPQAEVIERDRYNVEVSHNFLKKEDRVDALDFDLIITNPPFSEKYRFLEICFQLGKPFCLLLPLQTLMTAQRIALFKIYKVDIFLLSPSPDFPSGNKDEKPLRTREVGFFYWNGIEKRGDVNDGPDFNMFYLLKRETDSESKKLIGEMKRVNISGEMSEEEICDLDNDDVSSLTESEK